MTLNKCNSCGKFKRFDQLHSEQAEGDGSWFECTDCLPSKDPRRNNSMLCDSNPIGAIHAHDQ